MCPVMAGCVSRREGQQLPTWVVQLSGRKVMQLLLAVPSTAANLGGPAVRYQVGKLCSCCELCLVQLPT